jgi:hypothetical protein
VVLEVEAGNWREIVAECQDRMIHLEAPLKRMGVELDLPLVAEATIGTRWGLDDVGRM